MVTREQWKALRNFGAWSIGAGIVAGGLSWWARVSPRVGAGAQLGFTVAGVLFGLRVMLDTRRIERERLACERRQLEILETAASAAHCLLSDMRELSIIRSQIEQLEAPKDHANRADWVN